MKGSVLETSSGLPKLSPRPLRDSNHKFGRTCLRMHSPGKSRSRSNQQTLASRIHTRSAWAQSRHRPRTVQAWALASSDSNRRFGRTCLRMHSPDTGRCRSNQHTLASRIHTRPARTRSRHRLGSWHSGSAGEGAGVGVVVLEPIWLVMSTAMIWNCRTGIMASCRDPYEGHRRSTRCALPQSGARSRPWNGAVRSS